MSSQAIQGLHVLVVDDSVDSTEALRMLLTALGHRATVAHTGAQALAAAKQQPPDLLLLDLALPDISGIEVARQLRQSGVGDTHVVGLSGFGSEEHRRRCLEAGCNDYLEKPVEASVLSALLARLKPRTA